MSETHIDVRTRTPLSPCGLPGHDDCGLTLVLDRLGEKWTVMTLAELSAGPRRYRELERGLEGISQRMMTLTLRRLERDGAASRYAVPQGGDRGRMRLLRSDGPTRHAQLPEPLTWDGIA